MHLPVFLYGRLLKGCAFLAVTGATPLFFGSCRGRRCCGLSRLGWFGFTKNGLKPLGFLLRGFLFVAVLREGAALSSVPPAPSR
jgi:hypothetical protein